MRFEFQKKMYFLFSLLWIAAEADYKFERQSVYGLTELVQEFKVSDFSTFSTYVF